MDSDTLGSDRGGVRPRGGREAEIVDLGNGTMLRRYRGTGFPEREALVMEHAHRHGFRVPGVLGDDGLVLERIDGPSMWEDIRRKPWRARRHMQVLAGLHTQLHRIDAPPGLASAGEGGTLLHLDFHPANVLLSTSGPFVIVRTRGAGLRLLTSR